ncbi:MAG: 23S rRNA (adenine(2030)-N(6))-methyltransferase RlmJ [Dokdonella sp.]
MNYRHAFHAGNFADVFKHTMLLELIDALEAKPSAFCYVDTHAGRGRYDLRSDEASKTGEAAAGVQRLLAAVDLPDALQRYVAQVRAFDAGDGDPLRHYPGSPLLARAVMREQDRAILCELQAEEAAALKSTLRGDARFAIHQRDGYAALKALLPPPQKRGLILIDPPFEAQAAEFDMIAAALADALLRWPNAIYAIWYPIKLRETLLPFHRWLHAHAGKADVLAAELLLQPANSPLRLSGCGIALINPPYQFDRRLQTWLPVAQDLLAPDHQGSHRIEWLKTA